MARWAIPSIPVAARPTRGPQAREVRLAAGDARRGTAALHLGDAGMRRPWACAGRARLARRRALLAGEPHAGDLGAGVAGTRVLGWRTDATYDESIYEASVKALHGVLRGVPAKTETVLLIGHNPGVLTSSSSSPGRGDEKAKALAAASFPTCRGLAVLGVASPGPISPPGLPLSRCSRCRAADTGAWAQSRGGAGVGVPSAASAASISSRVIPSR